MAGKPKKQGPSVLTPFQQFAQMESFGGIILLISSVVAFVWANTPGRGAYFFIWWTDLSIGLGTFYLSKPLELWINDGLMALFFFLVGLEIKRELVQGELASVRRAALPFAAALGGMVAPAAIYIALNWGTPEKAGWGIPMATDIAFALGILALLGSRIPAGLKVFLTALAIIDDLGAVLVIAFFYTEEISRTALGVAGGLLMVLIAGNLLGVRRSKFYSLVGLCLWFAVLKSGVHATIAGILTAFTVPLTKPSDSEPSLLEDMERRLHPWVAYLILPLFALANAGVTLDSETASPANPVSLGVILGLFVGKPVGITLAALLAVSTGIAALPESTTRKHILGAAMLGGIGFTMSLFVAGLAFSSQSVLAQAKVGILAASLLSGIAGYLTLRR